MPDSTPPQTLGQRIDAVLQPLYSEAEQYRNAMTQARAKLQAAQDEVDAAARGLAQIESRMVDVVRSLAGQEPVLAAVLLGKPIIEAQTQAFSPVEIQADAAAPACEAEAPALAEPVADDEEPALVLAENDDPLTLEAAQMLDSAPQVAEDEAQDMLAEFEAESEVEAEVESGVEAADEPVLDAPPPDIAAAAERAAAAAKQLRESAGARR